MNETFLDRREVVIGLPVALVVASLAVGLFTSDPVIRGVFIGAAIGMINLVVGLHFTRRTITSRSGAAMMNIAAGFGARFLALMVLLGLFTFAKGLGVSPAAFAFTFLAFVFVYFGFEALVALRFLRREPA